MDISLRVAGSGPADQLAAFAARVEEAGLAGMGVPDSQLIMRDVYVNLALAAQSTSRLRLYTAVTNPMTCHASVLASAAQTGEELAPGRVAIIIGSGYSAVQTIGRKAATMDQMREAVVTMKGLLAGERVVLEGFEAHLPFASGRQIPVLIGATGPRTIELAGEVADGALIAVGVHPAMMETARRRFEAGARKSGQGPGIDGGDLRLSGRGAGERGPGLFCTPEQCVRRLGELEEWGGAEAVPPDHRDL